MIPIPGVPTVGPGGRKMQRPDVGIVATLVILAASITAPAQSVDRAALKKAMDSVVFLRMSRSFGHAYFTTSGTGFFVHPDGYVLTNWHVVADTVEMRMDGVVRDINAKVLDLEVVIGSGSANERVIPGKIVALDRQRDLALLEVGSRAPSWLDVSEPHEVHVTDRVWVIGFPLGEMLAMGNDSRPVGFERNPEVSVNSGLVTSLRRDEGGKLAMVQTDAAVNPGNSGGPLINDAGQVVGVVNAKIMRTEGLGFAISPAVLDEFVSSKAASVSVEPGVIVSPPVPLEITVKPILADLGPDLTARVVLEGDDIQPVRTELVLENGVWEGSLPAPVPIAGLEPPKYYLADVVFSRSDGREVMHRRFRLQNVAAFAPKLSSDRTPEQVMADRHDFPNERNMRRDSNTSSTTRGGKSSLSDYASKHKVSQDGESVVIDQKMVFDTADPLQRRLPDERYENFDDPIVREAVKRFDACLLAKEEIERASENVARYENDANYQTRRAAAQAKREIEQWWDPIMICYERYREKAVEYDVVFCHDDERWYFSHALPTDCRWPETP